MMYFIRLRLSFKCGYSFTYHLTNITSLILDTYYGEGLGLGLDIKLSP